MNTKQIKRILSGMGSSADTPTQIPELRTIIGETNHGIDFMRDLITFDTSHHLIKIKERDYEASNGKLSYETVDDTTLRTTKFSIYILHPVYRFRAPKVGDVAYLADRSTGEILSAKYRILAAGIQYVTLDKKLPAYDKTRYVLCYSSEELLAESTESPIDETLLIKYTDLSKFKTDVYINLDYVFGLEMAAHNRLHLS